MALKLKNKPSDYISMTAYAYDIAKNSKYFDKSVYEGLSQSGDQDAIKQYLFGLAEAKDKTASAFDQYNYNYLSSPEDKASYTLYKLSGESDSELDEYFNNKVQQAIDTETYESMNVFQKTMSSIGGIVGNALNETLLGTVEGLVDAGAVLVGQKDWAAEDFTPVGELREDLQTFSRKYTYLDKNKVWGVANDVAAGLAQMAPLLLNIPAPGLGSAIYFGAMAGNTASDAVRINPDIDYGSLLLYTGLVTGVEFATEKISAGIFGGAGNAIDNLIFKSTGKGLTKLGQKTTGNWLARVGLNFLSEGLEESVAEVADTMLFNALIAQGDEGLRKNYSITDILYAGLIGGLIGGLAEGGRLTTATRYSLTKDGQLVKTKDAKKAGIETAKDLGKLQSVSLREQINTAMSLAKTNAITDLIAKYEGKYTAEQLAEIHPDEYQNAVEKNQKTQQRQTEVILGLNRIFELAGVEGFNRATDLANSVFETQQRLLSKYTARALGTTAENRAVESEFARKNPGASITITDALTAEQLRFKQNFKNKFRINAYFGDFGTEDGQNRKFGLTLDENTIIIDEAQFGKMSEQEILDKIVKEELVHALQFTKGIITPKTLLAIHEVLGDTTITKQDIEAYSKEGSLTKLTEAQAKAIAQILIFDDLTVSKMFYSEYSTLKKVYNFFRNIRNKLETSNKDLRTEKGKLKYNTLLKRMKSYRDIAAKKLGTIENVEQFIEEFHLTELEQKQLRNAYLENPNIGPISGAETIAFAKEDSSEQLQTQERDTKPSTVITLKKSDGSGEIEIDLESFVGKNTLNILNSYLNSDNLYVRQIDNAYFVTKMGKGGRTIIISDSMTELINDLLDNNLISSDIVETLNEHAQSYTEIKELSDGSLITVANAMVVTEDNINSKRFKKAQEEVKKNFNQVCINFEQYFDEAEVFGHDADVALVHSAQSQITPFNDLNITRTDLEIKERLKSISVNVAASAYQGDYNNPKYLRLTREMFDNNLDIYENLTADDIQKQIMLLSIEQDVETSQNALVSLYIWGYEHRNSEQLKSKSDYFKLLYKIHVSNAGKLMAWANITYGTRTIQNAMDETADRLGIDYIKLPDELFKTLDDEYKDFKNYIKLLKQQKSELEERVKQEPDKFKRDLLRYERDHIDRLLTSLEDGDINAALDEQVVYLQEDLENATENQKKIKNLYEQIAKHIATRDTSPTMKAGSQVLNNKQLPQSEKMKTVTNIFKGINSYRYLAMLTSFSTVATNQLSNISNTVQAFFEDRITKGLEKTPWLRQDSQINYFGEYDAAFKKEITDLYAPVISRATEGNKYTTTEMDKLLDQIAKETDPLQKITLFRQWKNLSDKWLSDSKFVSKRAMTNLTNMLAGAYTQIAYKIHENLYSKYLGKKAIGRNRKLFGDKQALINQIKETNPELAQRYENSQNGDKLEAVKLALDLGLDIVSPDSTNSSSIVYQSLYRSNELYFKLNNMLTTAMTKLRKKAPGAAVVLEFISPFMRMQFNSMMHMFHRSPVGLGKAIYDTFKLKKQWSYEQRLAIQEYYKQVYIVEETNKDKNFVYKKEGFAEWSKQHIPQNHQAAIAGDKQALLQAWTELSDAGKVDVMTIGAADPFARGRAMERVSQGIMGTAQLILGALLVGLGFIDVEWDDDDLYGPVLVLGDKFKLDMTSLSPMGIMFTTGAVLFSGNVDDKTSKIFDIWADASIFSMLNSAMSYSNGIWDYLQNLSITAITQFQPAILKKAAKVMNNAKKDKSGTYIERLGKSIASNSVFLTWFVPNKINPYTGEVEPNYEAGWWEGIADVFNPLQFRVDKKSDFEMEAESLGVTTTGVSGSFTINNTDYTLTGKNKEKYAKYKAQYINNRFNAIYNGSEKVTIKDKKTGKYKTVKYSSLTNEEKQRVLKNLYTTGTTVTKIQYWLDQGNSYYVTTRDQYYDYKKLFGNSANIVYKKSWSKSKFVEG